MNEQSMNEQESWIERRQRMIRCRSHGLHYDPKLSSGCTLCLREAGRTQRPRSPQLTIILLCLLGMAAVLYKTLGPGQGAGTGLPGPQAVAEADVGPVKLDPEPYSQQIRALESVLFAPVEEREELAGTAASLATAAGNLGAEVRSRAAADGAAEDVARLERRISADSFTFADLERARSNWLRIRDHHWLPAAWFETPAEAASPERRAELAEYREVAGDLVSLLREVAAEAHALADVAGAAGSDRAAGWQEYVGDWRERVGELWKRRPGRPDAVSDIEILTAVQDLERAFQRAWALASDSGLARASQRAGRFDDALELAEGAQRAFDDIRL